MNSREALEASAHAGVSLLEQMRYAVVAIDLEGVILHWNQFAEAQFQWASSEVVGRRFTEIAIPPEHHESANEALRVVRETGHAEVETTYQRRDGSTFYATATCTNLRSSTGETIGQIGVIRDVSKERAIERDLKASEERFQSLAEGAPLMIWMTNREGELEYVNSRASEFLGLSPDLSTGNTPWDKAIHPDDHEETLDVYRRAVLERRALRHEYRLRGSRTKEYAWIMGSCVPRRSKSGKFAGMVGHGLDVTTQRLDQEGRRRAADVAESLAQVGQQLISSLHSPHFLDTLCALCAKHLDAASAHTLLLREDATSFELIAGTWKTDQERTAALGLKVSLEATAPLVERLLEKDVTAVRAVPEEFLALSPTLSEADRLCMALRQRDQLIGIQTVGRFSGKPFTETQLAIARGIAHLASLSLDHARLVEELERANRVKSDFVATMSHELRTPLHVILGYSDLLLMEEFGALSPDQAEVIQRVDRRARELHDLIANTLDVSRLDSGRIRVNVEEISLANFLAEIDLETQRAQEDAGIRLGISVPEDLPTLYSDPIKLKVVVKNLVSNALKFTSTGTVSVGSRADEKGIEIIVRDTGIGIARDQLASIFEPFQQIDGSSSRRHGGAGLGLYIVRRLLDLLGGSIAVESEPDHGSTFRVWLPQKVEVAPDQKPASGS